MRKPAWAHRQPRVDVTTQWAHNVVADAVEEFTAQVTEALREVADHERFGGTFNGSYTHYGLRRFETPELDAERATLVWLHANKFLTRKAVPGDGTYFERTPKGHISLRLPTRYRVRFRYKG